MSGVKFERAGMAKRRIAHHAAVKIEGGQGMGCGEIGLSGGIEELTPAAPELNGKVVEGVVSVRESGEDTLAVFHEDA